MCLHDSDMSWCELCVYMTVMYFDVSYVFTWQWYVMMWVVHLHDSDMSWCELCVYMTVMCIEVSYVLTQ